MLRTKEFAQTYAEMHNVPFGVAFKECEKYWKTLAKLLYEDREDITIYGVCAFKQHTRKATQVRHPKTKELVDVPSKTLVKFFEPERATS